MKILLDDELYHVNQDEELEGDGPAAGLPLDSLYHLEDLVIDPTDGQLLDAGVLKPEELC